MTVTELIDLLEKVKTRNADVFIDDPHIDNEIEKAVVCHELRDGNDDYIYVVLKTQ